MYGNEDRQKFINMEQNIQALDMEHGYLSVIVPLFPILISMKLVKQ